MRARAARRSFSAIFAGSVALVALAGPAAAEAQAPTPVPVPVAVAVPLTLASHEIPIASLPEGHLLDQSWDRQPTSLPAGAKIAGVKLHRSATGYKGQRESFIEVAEADDKDATADDESPRLQSLCFESANMDDVARPTRRRVRGGGATMAKIDGDDQQPARWSGGMSTRTTLSRSRDGQGHYPLNDRVQQLHIEQIVTGAQGPELESRDVWIDAETGGARLHAAARMPLRDLGERTVGLHLFAARVGDEVVFVAAQSPTSRNLFGIRKDQGAQMTNCGHLSLRLDVKRGMSELASFETIVTLPEPETAPEKADSNEATVDNSEDFRNGKARHTTPQKPSIGPGVRTRVGRIFFNTSWEPGEAAPLLSYSESWGNRPHDE